MVSGRMVQFCQATPELILCNRPASSCRTFNITSDLNHALISSVNSQKALEAGGVLGVFFVTLGVFGRGLCGYSVDSMKECAMRVQMRGEGGGRVLKCWAPDTSKSPKTH